MAARVQIEIEARDSSTAVLRAISAQFGMMGRAMGDVSTFMDAQTRLAKAQATALNAVAIGADNAEDAIRELKSAEDNAGAASARLVESLVTLGIEGAKKLYQIGKEAAQLELVEIRFNRLADSIGTTADVLMDELQTATSGMYSDSELMNSALNLMSLGLAKSQDEVIRLSTVSAGLNMDMNQLVLTLGNMTTMRFDALGVSVDGFDARMDKLKETMKGASEADIFKEAFLQQAEEQLLKVGSAADTSAGQFMKAEAEWKNFTDDLKMGALEAVLPVVTAFNDVNEKTKETQEVLENLTESGVIPVGTNLRFLSDEQQRYVNEITKGAEMTEFYKNQMQDLNPVIVEQAEAVKEIDYKSLIGDIQDYQKEIDRYNDKNKDLMETQRELKAEQSELEAEIQSLITKGYSPAGKTVQDVKGKLDELNKKIGDNKNALSENAQAHQEWAAQTVYAFAMARAGADGMIDHLEGEVLIEAGQALGLFDRKTAQTMRNVNSAFDSLDSSNAQSTIATLQEQLALLTETDYYVNIYGVYVPDYDTPGLPGDTNCFVEDTPVLMGDMSQTYIQYIQVGDVVLTRNTETGATVPARVSKVWHHNENEMGEYYLSINDRVKVTPNHLLFVNGEWKAAGEIHVSDQLTTPDGVENVYSISRVYRQVKTYNLEVEHDNHNYFASGILAHNGKQTGGTVMAGNSYMVGERGPEPFIPAVNGRVLGHAESLHALSMGGGGGAYNFYGNVTLQIGEETGAGLMSMR